MSELFGFKYTVTKYEGYNCYIEYIILSISDGKYFIDKYSNGKKYHFDITDKMDLFCTEINNLCIDNWNMNDYKSSMYWFPPAHYWTFQLNTDTLSVACKGQGEYPSNWNDFWTAFNKMCSQ